MGFLANILKTKQSDKVEAAMSVVHDKSEDLSRALGRLDNIVRGNIERTVDRAFEENARLTGRTRQK